MRRPPHTGTYPAFSPRSISFAFHPIDSFEYTESVTTSSWTNGGSSVPPATRRRPWGVAGARSVGRKSIALRVPQFLTAKFCEKNKSENFFLFLGGKSNSTFLEYKRGNK